MGYYIFSCGIKKNHIDSAFGSESAEILEKVIQNSLFEGYSHFEVKGLDKTPLQALNDIIYGRSCDEKSNYAYGYALIGICTTLGMELPYTQEIKLGYETDLINKFLVDEYAVENFLIEHAMFGDNSNPFPIPTIKDWPLIGLLTLAQLKEIKTQLQHVMISDVMIEEFLDSEDEDEEEKGFASEHIQGVLTNIDFCIENELDMISFCH